MNNNNRQFRQGDVFLQLVDELPGNLQLEHPPGGRAVLAQGEVTGHAHEVVPADAATLYLNAAGPSATSAFSGWPGWTTTSRTETPAYRNF